MKSLFTLVSLSLFSWGALPAQATQVQQKPKSFAQWCQQQKSLPTATQKTIDALLKEAGTNRCQLAEAKLSRLKNLNLSFAEISDLQPLASLNNLTSLNLNSNQITDLQPLIGLHKLESLLLTKNQISDLQPLNALNKLTHLDLDSNQIVDIQPLAKLKNLTILEINFNQISNIHH
jgi:internalin A